MTNIRKRHFKSGPKRLIGELKCPLITNHPFEDFVLTRPMTRWNLDKNGSINTSSYKLEVVSTHSFPMVIHHLVYMGCFCDCACDAPLKRPPVQHSPQRNVYFFQNSGEVLSYGRKVRLKNSGRTFGSTRCLSALVTEPRYKSSSE